MFPIIMISSSPTALITMHNVKRFLQESVFEPSQEARARAIADGNVKPDDMIAVYRKRTTIDSSGRETESQARYYVVDSVESLSKFGLDPWDRVVCVMTTGQEWQFKNYKWKDPKQLFHNGKWMFFLSFYWSFMCLCLCCSHVWVCGFVVKGMYFSWVNDPQNPKIKDWNVTELKVCVRIPVSIVSYSNQIDAHRRHVDKSVVAHFWKAIDSWTLANKPWLTG
jgi:parafibromin